MMMLRRWVVREHFVSGASVMTTAGVTTEGRALRLQKGS